MANAWMKIFLDVRIVGCYRSQGNPAGSIGGKLTLKVTDNHFCTHFCQNWRKRISMQDAKRVTDQATLFLPSLFSVSGFLKYCKGQLWQKLERPI